MDYKKANDFVNIYLFSGRYEDREVYLDFEGNLPRNLANDLGIHHRDIEETVFKIVSSKLRPDLNNPFSVLVADSQDWISNPGVDAPPPTTLFLCSLSLVAESMSSENNLSLNNYYDRFLTAFDITDDGLKKRIKTNFKSTEKLWIDLNEWLTRHGGARHPNSKANNANKTIY